MWIRLIAAIAAAALLIGCAIHPVPEDVTGLSTADIVKQIRCETRDAARDVIIKYLTDLAVHGNSAIAADLLAQFNENRDSMASFDARRSFPDAAHAQIRNVFEVIYSAGVGYTFDLTMTEDNNLGATANFVGPWLNKFTLGLTGDGNRTRQNERTFTITDTVGFLLRELNTPKPNGDQYCDGHVAFSPNYIYPIAGRVGIYNTVYTFFELSFFDGLAANKADPGGSGAPVMADKLTFTTMIDLIAMPKVVFAPVGNAFQVADASATGTLRRTDAHQVTVGLALAPKGKGLAALSALKGFVFSGAALGGARVAIGSKARGDLLVLNRVTATTTSYAEQLAVLAIDQLKSRELQLITRVSP
ncbi:hypothetical protein [Bradyrhizobium sp. Gha]|uniref:hypothetical protein n=1 Tax=Bradyrhizobium sp. Gha TaxID=1855318 RepID=UPI0008E31E82|nr:hypothetical protein [Bradyrhizobium sp. Gha]SFI61449.1 hypothetical protein SAMN05216525_11152 [Bradyrhizobium sp. Gha]